MSVTENSAQSTEKKRVECKVRKNGEGAGREDRDWRVVNTQKDSMELLAMSNDYFAIIRMEQ